VVVIVNASGNGCVVIVPFGPSDLSVTVFVTEARKVFSEHFLSGHLSADNLGVEAAIKDWGQVRGSNATISVPIELCESLGDDLHAFLVGHATNANKELVIVDKAVFVGVKALNKNLTFALADGDSEVLDAPVELLLVELAVSIIVNNAECTTHTTDSLCSAFLERSTYLGDN
jgi:hypothetical protein